MSLLEPCGLCLHETELSDLDWHTISTDEVIRRLSSSIEHGLSSSQVERKKKEHGKNMPSKPPSNTLSKYFFFYAKVQQGRG